MAAQAAVNNPLNVPTVRHYTFQADLFGDPSRDPWSGQYQNLLAPFDIDINNNATNMQPATVRENLTNSTNNLEPIALLLVHDNAARVYLLPLRMTSTLGTQYPTHIDGNMFALDGDLHRNCPLVVQLPDALFNQIQNQVLVPEVAHITAQLAADATIVRMGPYNQGDANTEVVRTRSVVTVPFSYVQLFMAAERMSPRTYFEQVYPQLVADGVEQQCLPLTRFFQVAITNDANNNSLLNVTALPTGSRSSHLLDRYDRLVRAHFPQLDTNLQQLQNTQIATQIAGLTQAYQQGRLQDELRRQAKSNNPVTNWLGDRVTGKLLNYCVVTQETLLPPIWAQLANAKHSDRLPILQAAISQKKMELHQPHLQFGVTMPLLATITSMNWEMVDKDDISTGLQPFRFCATDEAAAMTHQQQVQLLLTGTSASLEDTNRLLTSTKIVLPTNINFSLYILRLRLLMQILLPDTHQLVTFLNGLYEDLESFRHNIGGFVTQQPALNGAATGVLICKWVANTVSGYFMQQGRKQQQHAIGRSPTDISEAITMESNWEPHLSMIFLSKYKVREFCNSISDRSGEIPQSPPAGPQPPSRPGVATSRRVDNPDYLSSLFLSYKQRQVKTKTVRDLITKGKITTPLPRSKVDGSLEQCLGWHTIGQCNTNCPKSADHIAYTSTELAPLAQWCQTCYPADQASADAALNANA